MPKSTEVSLSGLPESLGERLNDYLDREYPYQKQRDQLRRAILLKSLAQFLDREAPETQSNGREATGYADPEVVAVQHCREAPIPVKAATDA